MTCNPSLSSLSLSLFLSLSFLWGALSSMKVLTMRGSMVTKVTMGGDFQPDCLADRLLTGLGQPQIYP